MLGRLLACVTAGFRLHSWQAANEKTEMFSLTGANCGKTWQGDNADLSRQLAQQQKQEMQLQESLRTAFLMT